MSDDFDRVGNMEPTEERLDKGGRYRWHHLHDARVISPALPTSVVKMRQAGTLNDLQTRAAEYLIADHVLGYESGIGTTAYRERVDGSPGGREGVAASVMDARRRYQTAKSTMQPPVWEVVKGVLIDGASLTAAGAYPERYSKPASRRVCAATLLGLGLSGLSEFYGLTRGPRPA